MILSHKYKFIFIKTRKTAGTSIEISLSRYCGDKDIITPLNPEDEDIRREVNVYPRNYLVPLRLYRGKEWLRWLRGWRLKYWDHMPAKHIKRFIGEEIYNSYFKFCFERNPWDKSISYYYWENRKNKYPTIDDLFQNKEMCTDYHKYSIDGEIAVDFIGKYENLMEDLNHVCEKLGIPFDGWMPRAKGGYRTDRRKYYEVLNESQRQFIHQAFRKEIDYLGYKYEKQP
jgi:hypothetical protein